MISALDAVLLDRIPWCLELKRSRVEEVLKRSKAPKERSPSALFSLRVALINSSTLQLFNSFGHVSRGARGTDSPMRLHDFALSPSTRRSETARTRRRRRSRRSEERRVGEEWR